MISVSLLCVLLALFSGVIGEADCDEPVVTGDRKNKDQPFRDILIVVAMEAEAKPFVEHLELVQQTDFFPSHVPFEAFSGDHAGCAITLVTSGKDTVYGTGVDNAGTVPASLVTYLSLGSKGFDLVVNAGTCGGFRAMGASIGDVFITESVAHHDRRIPLGAFEPYGIGRLETLSTPKLVQQHSYKTGVCSTGNSLDKTEEDLKHMEANRASVKDMEAAAVAWSSSLFDKPYLGVKVVTDIVDGNVATPDEFMENLHTAAARLQDALPKIIEHACGRTRIDM